MTTIPQHTSNISFPGMDSGLLAMNLNSNGIALSTDPACQSAVHGTSYVFPAMGRTSEDAVKCIGFSLEPGNTASEVDGVVDAIAGLVEELSSE